MEWEAGLAPGGGDGASAHHVAVSALCTHFTHASTWARIILMLSAAAAVSAAPQGFQESEYPPGSRARARGGGGGGGRGEEGGGMTVSLTAAGLGHPQQGEEVQQQEGVANDNAYDSFFQALAPVIPSDPVSPREALRLLRAYYNHKYGSDGGGGGGGGGGEGGGGGAIPAPSDSTVELKLAVSISPSVIK
jgi:hypothetical protein